VPVACHGKLRRRSVALRHVIEFGPERLRRRAGHADSVTLVPAYAATIHKSQGSGFPAVIIPVLTQHYPMLQRNLLYTGLNRGRRLVVLVGQRKAIAIAVRNVSGRRRWTRLLQCLGGSMSASQVDSVRQNG